MTDFITKNKRLKPLLALAFWLAVWQLAAHNVGQELLIPAPGRVLSALTALISDGEFWHTAALSLLRVFGGFMLGVLIGFLLAALTAFSPALDCLISPIIRIIRATPVASFIILALLWIGYPLIPVFIAMLMVTPVMWGNVRAGIGSADPKLLELARAFRFSKWKKLRLIYLPTLAPYFYSGCITSLGIAWKSGIAAEVLCLPKLAIGTRLYYSKIYLETPSLFAWTIVVILLSYALEKVFVSLFASQRKKWEGAEL